MKNYLKYCPLVALFLLGCSTEKRLIKLSEKDRDLRSNELILYVQNRNNSIETFNAKAACDIILDGKKNSFNITLKSKIDSAIWISISPALGIEVARVMLTPDSVLVLNKIERSYIYSDYTSLSEMVGSDVDFNDVQDLFLYRIIKHRDKDKYNNRDTDSTYVLNKNIKGKIKRKLGISGQNNDQLNIDLLSNNFELDTTKRNTQRLLENEVQILISTVISKNNLALLSQSIKNINSNQELNLKYGSNFYSDSTYAIPQTMEVNVYNDRVLFSKFSLDFTRFRVNEPVNFRLAIPPRYENNSP